MSEAKEAEALIGYRNVFENAHVKINVVFCLQNIVIMMKELLPCCDVLIINAANKLFKKIVVQCS